MLSPSFIVSSDTQRISSLLQLNLLPSEGSGVACAILFFTECGPLHRAVLDFDDIPPFVFVVSASSRTPPCCEPVTIHVVFIIYILAWLSIRAFPHCRGKAVLSH